MAHTVYACPPTYPLIRLQQTYSCAQLPLDALLAMALLEADLEKAEQLIASGADVNKRTGVSVASERHRK